MSHQEIARKNWRKPRVVKVSMGAEVSAYALITV